MHLKFFTASALLLTLGINLPVCAQSGTEASSSRLTIEQEAMPSWRMTMGLLYYALLMQQIDSDAKSPSKKFEINTTDVVADKPGVYHIIPADTTLSVGVDKNGIVRFTVSDANGNVVMQSDVNASAYSRWKIYCSKSRELWLNSRDIGIYVWVPQDDGRYKRAAAFDLNKVPKEVTF